MPEPVLEQAAAEMLDWHGSGMSVMEMSHRGEQFIEICTQAEADLRELLAISSDYAVLFMQGGATAENAIVPLNLLGRVAQPKADFVISGIWATKSHDECQRYGDAHIAATNAVATTIDGVHQAPFTWLPDVSTWRLRKDAAYLHI